MRGAETGAVREALTRLAAATDLASSEAAYHRMLDAIGHDHSGTLRRSALPAVDDLLAIACAGRAWSADAALNVLTEVTTSFALELGAGVDHEEQQRFTRSLVAVVATRREGLARLARSADQQRTRERAAALGAVLDEVNP